MTCRLLFLFALAFASLLAPGLEALVPTHDRTGAWTGFFCSRGC